jgi:hypothetical protein
MHGYSLVDRRLPMAQYSFRLQGWQAVAALVVMAGITGVEMYSRIRPVDDGMRDAVRAELLQEYSGRGPKDIARFVAEARSGSPVEPVPALVQRDVEFTSMAARGRMGGGSILVRADVTIDGGPPPDGRLVRYFRVQRKFGGEGWLVVGESDAYQYFMELLPARRSYWGSN